MGGGGGVGGGGTQSDAIHCKKSLVDSLLKISFLLGCDMM
jgi:hypothetical protein